MTTTRQRSIVFALALGLATTAACSSSSKNASSSGTTVGTSGTCPFSGSVQPQTQTGMTSPTQLTSVQSSTAGCIDNVQFHFDPTLATSQTAYESAAPGATGAVLVVTLESTTLASKFKTGTVKVPEGLHYVSNVDVSTPSGAVKITVTLDQKRPYLVSSSQVPPQLTLAIG